MRASGFAARKQVIGATSKAETCKAVQEKSFGAAGETTVVEALLEGQEVSCLYSTDGRTVAPIPATQDHQ